MAGSSPNGVSFCSVCNNLLFARGGTSLTFQCLRCPRAGDEDAGEGDREEVAGEVVLYTTGGQAAQAGESYTHLMTPMLKTDPTLPRTREVVCPAPDCPDKKGGEPAPVCYTVFSESPLRILFTCPTCDTFFGPSELGPEGRKPASAGEN